MPVPRREFLRQSLGGAALLAGMGDFTGRGAAPEPAPGRLMPKVSGRFRVRLRRRQAGAAPGDVLPPDVEVREWEASGTALILCDMWADHPCKLAAQRVGEMAPRMNTAITAARDRGAFIVHAPSGGVHFYEDTPFRMRLMSAMPGAGKGSLSISRPTGRPRCWRRIS